MTEQQAAAAPKNEVVMVNDKPFSLTELGYDGNTWLALKNTLYPDASPGAIQGVLRLCKARNLDPMKKPFAIISFNSKGPKGPDGRDTWEKKEIIVSAVNDLRTTAMRTGQYAGCDEAVFGPEITKDFTGTKRGYGGKADQPVKVSVTFPEWCQLTVYRLLGGQRMPFPGPKVYFEEAYGAEGSGLPNPMWQDRPRGMLEKCAEAAALRRAFPEELGNEQTIEEMNGRDNREIRDVTPVVSPEVAKVNALAAAVGMPTPEPVAEPDPLPAEVVVQTAANDNGRPLQAEVLPPEQGSPAAKPKVVSPATVAQDDGAGDEFFGN
jgi:phage recombination protein Bet